MKKINLKVYWMKKIIALHVLLILLFQVFFLTSFFLFLKPRNESKSNWNFKFFKLWKQNFDWLHLSGAKKKFYRFIFHSYWFYLLCRNCALNEMCMHILCFSFSLKRRLLLPVFMWLHSYIHDRKTRKKEIIFNN